MRCWLLAAVVAVEPSAEAVVPEDIITRLPSTCLPVAILSRSVLVEMVHHQIAFVVLARMVAVPVSLIL